ncbi:MAG: ABC transporter ATP-binding protein [Pseudomonadota bacterium]|jgi:putative ABC transport system ATP-binding protein|nr:ABC transporter ATP-binding protein [Pseudomonadota bacterium]
MNVTASIDPIVALTNVRLILRSDAGPVNILRGVDLSVAAGEKISIVGPSGAGKTSLMMIVAGLEKPTDGTVSVAGTNLGGLNEDGLALFRRDNMGIVFQDFHLIPTMNAMENVALPLELAGHRDALQTARDRLDAVRLGHRLTHYPGQLSGGEQQRVALARAFAMKPKLLLADEPTGNLDSDTGARVIELMFALSAELGTTLLLITHEGVIAGQCDRTIRIEDGLIASTATC